MYGTRHRDFFLNSHKCNVYLLGFFSGQNPFPAHPVMSKEGALWFPDLTLPDYTGMLPVFLGMANLSNIEVNRE